MFNVKTKFTLKTLKYLYRISNNYSKENNKSIFYTIYYFFYVIKVLHELNIATDKLRKEFK